MESKEEARLRRKQYVDRQATIYFESSDALKTCRDRAKASGLTMNAYVLEAIQLAEVGEGKVKLSDGRRGEHKKSPIEMDEELIDVETLNKLKQENLKLHADLEWLRKAAEEEHLQHSLTMHLDDELPLTLYNVLSCIRDGHVWNVRKITDELNKEYPRLGDTSQIARAIRYFEDMELIVETKGGWRLSDKWRYVP
jgi:hypothetical protein